MGKLWDKRSEGEIGLGGSQINSYRVKDFGFSFRKHTHTKNMAKFLVAT
jgi:hypothetical protein